MAIAGKAGKVMIAAATVAKVSSWSLDISSDMLDDTALGDSWKGFISGLNEWSGSLDCKFAVHTDTTGQKALQDAILGGTSVAIKLYVNATNYYSGTAFLSGMSPEDPVDDVVTISFDFQGSGALTYA